MLENISVVLVEPLGDENIGMAARAMKNCDIFDLRLVNPVPYKTSLAYKWACNSRDIIDNAMVFSSLNDAVSDATLAVALSGRKGRGRPPLISFSKLSKEIIPRSRNGKISFIFGRETDGLNKEELSCCDLVVSIPTSKTCSSLNLAQAVLLVCHEVYKESLGLDKGRKSEDIFVPKGDVKRVLDRFSEVLTTLDYDKRSSDKVHDKILKQFHKLFCRGGLLRKDINMFLGLLARIEEKLRLQ